MESLTTHCVIAGGGPAGLMCGYLLARSGVDVWVLEKHADFLRDFRGDTIHPSTLQVMDELGLLEKFLNRPHDEVREVTAEFGKDKFTVADMTRLPTRAKFMAFMPQWEFLNFLVEEAKRFPNFHIAMEAEVRELLAKKKRIVGVRVRTPDGEGDILARLVIGADGRHSVVRAKAKLKVIDIGAPFDVLWMRLPAEFGDPHEPVARFAVGGLFIMLNRRTYWQCAMVIPKGAFATLKNEGMSGFRARLRTLAGFARDRVETIESFDDIKLLTVMIDRLKRWARPGLLCIGDAAHAMSPVGGIGINLAIQDAVAAANVLAEILPKRAPSLDDLKRVQARREFPTKATQWVQVQIQNNVLASTLRSEVTPRPPWFLHMLNRVPWLRQ
ncbi:MAG: FAD-dependent oxidoreductase, partial [Alphaproteobacteria bacterium]|nr:FAD-dependent oxidoreductase [Alphaproteobacteria bacterium]